MKSNGITIEYILERVGELITLITARGEKHVKSLRETRISSNKTVDKKVETF